MTNLNEYKLNRTEKAVFIIAIIILSILLSLLFYRNIVFALIIIPFGSILRRVVEGIIVERRKREFMLEFKDFLFTASTAIGAGRSMKDAIAESIPSIEEIYGSNAILAIDLKMIYQRIEYGGENDVKVLMDFATSSGMEDVIDFVNIYSICKHTGANLIKALNKAANVIIDKMTIEREVQEISRRKESEGLILLIMPIIVLLFLNLSSPEYISPLYETIAGRIIMTFIISGNIGVFILIRKITSIEI